MSNYKIALSVYDDANRKSRVVLVDVAADTSQAAYEEIGRRKDDPAWLKEITGGDMTDNDDVIDGIRVDDWQVVRSSAV